MDSYGHVNHARTVTLLEEARVDLVFTEAARHGIDGLARGLVVAKLSVEYLHPLIADGGSIKVEMAVKDMRAASFTMDYKVRSGRNGAEKLAVTAETLLVPYTHETGSPRRLTDAERDFLAGWLARSDSGDA
jgi:acyl-CoA thioester hydrolase